MEQTQTGSKKKPLTIKSSVLEKALKERKGSVQDALAGIPNISDNRQNNDAISTASDASTTPLGGTPSLAPAQTGDIARQNDTEEALLNNQSNASSKPANAHLKTGHKPCCQYKAEAGGNMNTDDHLTDPPSNTATLTHINRNTHPSALGLETAGKIPADLISNNLNAGLIQTALPSTKRSKFEHGPHHPTYYSQGTEEVKRSDIWNANGVYAVMADGNSLSPNMPHWSNQNQTVNPSTQRRNSVVHPTLTPNSQGYMTANGNAPFNQVLSTTLQAQCGCGETCQCLGCADHPTNARTTDYVRDTVKYMLTDNYDQMSSPTRKVAVGQGYQVRRYSQPRVEKPRSGGSAARKMIASNLAAHASLEELSNPCWPSQATNQYPTTLQADATSLTQISPIGLKQNFYSHEGSRELSADDHFATGAYSGIRRTATDEDGVCLSPSAFNLQQFVIPGCSDMTGACLCGDGCTCEGCLTHNGHNGLAFNASGSEIGSAMLTPTSSTISYYYDGAMANSAAMPHLTLAQKRSADDTSVPG